MTDICASCSIGPSPQDVVLVMLLSAALVLSLMALMAGDV